MHAVHGGRPYEADGAFLPFKGRWQIDVGIRGKGADDVGARFIIDTKRAQGPAYAQVVPGGQLFYSVARSSSDPALLLAAGDGFYRSTDAGLTWQQAQGKGAYRVMAVPGDPKGFLAAGAEGLARTSDAGESWRPLYQEKGTEAFDAVFAPNNPSAIVLATAQGILPQR